MKIAKDVFVGKENGRYTVYSPLTRKISVVNEAFLQGLKGLTEETIPGLLKEYLDMYQNAGVIVDEDKIPQGGMETFLPTSVTLFPTSDCNLRCVYCYGNAGIEPHTLDIAAARKGIDFIVENAVKTNQKKIKVGYHGGGEPTFAWDVLTESVEYAKAQVQKNNLKPYFSLATNGVLTEHKLDYIVQTFSNIQLSMDGPEDIQNRQRPLYKPLNPGLSGSYEGIMATVERFQKEKVHFTVRPTITNETVDRMEEIAKFFIEKVKPTTLHMEPLFVCGRCSSAKGTESKWSEPNQEKYCENYFKLLDLEETAKIIPVTSMGDLRKLSASFCGAAGNNFCMTPEGYVTSCFEVGLKSDKRSDVFFFGRYNSETDRIDIDESKRQFLRSRTVTNMPHCDGCFLKWNCGGECLAKVYNEGDLFNPNNYSRCKLNKTMAKQMIERKVNKSNGGTENGLSKT